MAHRLNSWQTLIYLHTIFSIGVEWENMYEVTLNHTRSPLPTVVIAYNIHSHLLETNTYKPSYIYKILMDNYKGFCIRSQWANMQYLTLNQILLH